MLATKMNTAFLLFLFFFHPTEQSNLCPPPHVDIGV